MAQTGVGWAQAWGLVRQVHQKIELVAFFDTQEDAEAAVAEAEGDCQVCWITYKDGAFFPAGKDDDE
jgi:hypothetical protein